MGDRVRFGTWNDTTTPANSSGFNGFPAPFASLDPGLLPLSADRQTMAKWFYRVREWNVTNDFSVVAGASNITIDDGLLASSQATRERDLVLRVYGTTGGSSGSRSGGNYNYVFNFFNVTADPTPQISTPDLVNFFPALQIAGTMSATDGANDISVVFNTDSSLLGSIDGSVSATLDGVGFTIYYSVSSTGTTSHTLATFIATPSLFWEYADKDGNPIYDSATGALLPGKNPED